MIHRLASFRSRSVAGFHPPRRALPGSFVIAGIILALAALPLTAQRRILRVPDLPGLVTLKCDFHTHTVFSDGNVWPPMRVDEAWRDGLDVLAITDHLEYLPHQESVPVDFNAAWKIAAPRAEEKNIILVHGAEITREMPPGHLNALFIRDASLLNVPDPRAAVEAAVRQGGFIMYNHPGWKQQQKDGVARLYPFHHELIAKGWLHGIEYYNTHEGYPPVLDMCRAHKLAVMGNSDIHDVISEVYAPPAHSHRLMTLVFAEERTGAAVREALFAGRTAAWCGDELAGLEEYTGPLFAAAVRVGKPYRSSDKEIWFELTNASDIPFYLVKGPQGAPAELNVPVGSTVIVKADRRYLAEPLSYEVRNVLIATHRGLVVKLRVPPA